MTNFITKGQVPTDESHLYVTRPSDTYFDEFLRRADYIAVIGPRFSGKTSLLARKFHELSSRQRYLPIYVNMTLLSKLENTAWYERLHTGVIQGARGALSDVTRARDELMFRDMLLDTLEGEIGGRVLVFMFDDVEKIPQSVMTPFMAMIREVFSSREMIPAFKRCIFVLSGCFLPDDLITDPSISPFRIAERVHMLDATSEGVGQLVRLLESADRPIPEWLHEYIYQWTEGDLYLTQRLLALLVHQSTITKTLIDKLATHDLTDDDLFRRIMRFLDSNAGVQRALKNIAAGKAPRFTRLQRQIAEGWLMGVLKENEDGNCAVRNPIYATAINLSEIDVPDSSKTHVMWNTPPIGTATEQTGRPIMLRDRYQVEGPTGEGGMAHVFRGVDRSNNTQVAIKRLMVELANDPTFVERFNREGESLRILNHPNIVRFIDLFAEDNYQYIVMEYVRGGNLSQLMHREGRGLSLRTVLQIMTGLADALSHAHSCNIVHRDIKPGNVLLTPDLTPRLADFGIARILTKAGLTNPGVLLGTLTYMSPEICNGEEATPQADMWSLGVVLFEMLTGYLPFDGSSPASIVTAILREPIPDVMKIRMDVPLELARVVRRLLHRELDKRYQLATHVIDDLREVMTVI